MCNFVGFFKYGIYIKFTIQSPRDRVRGSRSSMNLPSSLVSAPGWLLTCTQHTARDSHAVTRVSLSGGFLSHAGIRGGTDRGGHGAHRTVSVNRRCSVERDSRDSYRIHLGVSHIPITVHGVYCVSCGIFAHTSPGRTTRTYIYYVHVPYTCTVLAVPVGHVYINGIQYSTST